MERDSVCNFAPYSTIFQLYDGSQFLLVGERTIKCQKLVKIYLFACNFVTYSTIFQLYDGGQFLLEKDRNNVFGERPTTFRK